ncbi:MAG: hypothetical protein ABR985_22385 [Methanotrichaceae archaeon]
MFSQNSTDISFAKIYGIVSVRFLREPPILAIDGSSEIAEVQIGCSNRIYGVISHIAGRLNFQSHAKFMNLAGKRKSNVIPP